MNNKLIVAILTAAMLMISAVGVLAAGPQNIAGAVYTMTNDDLGNEVVIFNRDSSGFLTKAGSVSTEGLGSGGGLDPLASQGSLVLSRNYRLLLAVNAGSNEVSVFRASKKGLVLVEKVDSGGVFPVSLAVHRNLVYVLNAQGTPNITGFYMTPRGQLTPIDDSTRLLGTGNFGQVGFDRRGKFLVVTDKADNEILVYPVDQDGLPATDPVTSPSNGAVPFGFIFDQRRHLLVVEAGDNAVSSYKILGDATLQVISPSVPNGQVAACWIVGNKFGNVFTSNPGTSSISSYRLRVANGAVTLLNGTAGLGNAPLDMGISKDNRFLYAVDPNNGSIDMFRIERDGSLTDLGVAVDGLSVFAQGLAAY